ncbi:hypothetical protein JOM56_001331 [Amanita muscaria]
MMLVICVRSSTAPIKGPPATTHPEGRRPFKVYKPCDISLPMPAVPDDYYNPTATDLKKAQSVLAARTQSLVNAPLQTRAMRDSTEKVKREKWPYTTIRVRFPDRTQLEAVYSSSDKIKSVYAFVRSCLKEDVKPIKFILYQSPPKRDLKVSDPNVRDLSLSELQLSPSSVLLLRFESEELNYILAQAIDLPLPPTYESTSSESRDRSSLQLPQPQPQERKAPKWFKLGLKKAT